MGIVSLLRGDTFRIFIVCAQVKVDDFKEHFPDGARTSDIPGEMDT